MGSPYQVTNDFFMNGVNFGNVFIPEDFFADDDFYSKYSIPKNADQNSLCDLTGDNAKSSMEAWMTSHIIESEFAEMKSFGINSIRLPLGYWNLIDMPGNPNAPSDEAERMGHLSEIMPAADYRKYIDQIISYSKANDIKILFDLHGAPGSQSGESNTGCSTKHNGNAGIYWDTEWNKTWTENAFLALAKICQTAGDTCYGVEILNEPSFDLDRESLQKFYQQAILKVREPAPAGVELDMKIPIVIMEWMPMWKHWEGNWQKYFPEETYGAVFLDTHIYDFKNTVADEEAAWDQDQWPSV